MTFDDILEMLPQADWSKEFKNLIRKASCRATPEEIKNFVDFFKNNNWHDLHGIESTTIPNDFFIFGDGDWDKYKEND